MNTGAHVIRTQCLRQRTELLLDADGRVRPRRDSPGIDLLMQLPAAWLSMSTPEYPAALEPMVAVLSAPAPRAASSAEQAIRTASDDLRLICPAPAGGATPDSRCD